MRCACAACSSQSTAARRPSSAGFTATLWAVPSGSWPPQTSRWPPRTPCSASRRSASGIVPAVISPFVLARIGEGPARRYFLTGERFGAFEALRIGLVHEVATDVDAAVERVLDALLAAGPEAVRAAKRLVLDASRRLHGRADRGQPRRGGGSGGLASVPRATPARLDSLPD